MLVDIVVLPDRNGRDPQNQNASSGNRTIHLAAAPGIVDRITSSRAHRICLLHCVSTHVDRCGIGFEIRRETRLESAREDVRIDSSRHSVSNGAPQAREQTDERQHHGDALAVRRRHDSHLLADDQRATTEGNEDLAHDHVADVVRLAPEMNHQARTQDHERQAEEQTGMLEVLGPAHPETEDNTPETGTHVVDLGHVAGHGGVEVVNDRAEVVEVEIPAVEAEVERCGHDTGAQDCALLQQLVVDEMDAGEPFLPSGEDEEEAEPNDDHCDEGRALVFCATVAGQAEGQQ